MGQRRGAYRVLVREPEGRNHLENPGVDGRIMLKRIFERLGGGDTNWINLAQDRDRWRALVNAVMNLRVP
jgi:hypothetical protein